MRLSRELLLALGVKPADADRHLDALVPAMLLHGIDTRLRIAHFLAQVLHESGRMSRVVENLNYSAEGLLKVFPRYFSDLRMARAYARQPRCIGSRVYGGRMGNCNEASGDGYRYRGRGLIQLTGKHNYREFSDWIGDDVVAEPDRVASHYAAHSAVFFWSRHDLNPLADRDDLKTITRRINGGLNGFKDRLHLLERAKKWFDRQGQPSQIDEAREAGETREADIDRRPEIFAPTHRVTATALNLRSAPQLSPGNRLATLARDEPVEVLGSASADGWVRVRVKVGDSLRKGVVAERYLTRLDVASWPDEVT